ncbi:hypothetical protein [Microbacterium candidum]|uniref:DUF1453 family protein n=1 Tax=Microbacterium candidum TaxID=3041922 RepID=A0ABT7MXH8_9MICO|nr:hypothetical protein [Microbacterium sp. ASV49]MDL9979161.1 hypothetical protein [Microbacterium sp. ASV49]
MDLQIIGNVLLAVVILAFVCYRQMTWRIASAATLWRMPVVMAAVGLYLLIRQGSAFTGLDAAVLAVEVVISLGVGAWMGAIAHFRRTDDAAGVAQFESRTGWWGLALWLVVIAVRIGIDVLANGLGAHAVTTTGVIILLLAANRIARAGVIGVRVDRLRASAGAQGMPRVVRHADA